MIFLTNPPELPDGGPANLVAGPVTVRDAEGKEHQTKVLLPGESVRDRIFAAAIGGCAPEVFRGYMDYLAKAIQTEDDPEALGKDLGEKLGRLAKVAADVADMLAEHAMLVRRANIKAMVEQMKPKGDNNKGAEQSRIIHPGQEGQT